MPVHVELLVDPTAADVAELAALLSRCVAHGASVGFLDPLAVAAAEVWWRTALGRDDAVTWVARDDDAQVVGCVRLVLARQDNGGHRGEVSKLLVAPDARRTGCASALLDALETWAREHGRHRLVLDTETGSVAESVYPRLGWQRVGVVPDFALSSGGELTPTTVFTKDLRPSG